MSSPNFELYTTSAESEGRQTLEAFEQARDFFLRVKPFAVSPDLPVTVVTFDSAREYRPYGLNEIALAYFTGDEQRDYVVMGDIGALRTRVAVHEYVHLLVRHSGLTLPLWLNEGLAEVYATMEAREGRILLGAIPSDRANSLGSQNWMSLPVLVRVAPGSPVYNEQDRAGMFYAQSWLLAHMLMLGDGYSDRFAAFVEKTSRSGTQAAFQEVFGKGIAEIEREAKAYFRQNTIGGSAHRFSPLKVETAPARPATELEVELTLAKLTALLGRTGEARKRLERLSAANRDNAEIDRALAYLEWRNGDRDAALRSFELALTHGAADWKTHWDYARLLDSKAGHEEKQLLAVRKALAAKPDLAEARILLGRRLCAMGRYEEALTELRQIQHVEPPQPAALFLTMAYAAAHLKQEKQAREYLEEARKHARRPEEQAGIEALLRDLHATQPNAAGTLSDTDEPARPILRRRQRPQ